MLSASWLHGNLLHILFNMMWVRDLGPATVDFVGPARTVIIYIVSGVCGFLLSSVAGSYWRVPMPFLQRRGRSRSARRRRFSGCSARWCTTAGAAAAARFVQSKAMRYAIILFVFGLIMPGVDNYAHAGGFVGGYATRRFSTRCTRERGDHMIVAAVCLVATVLALAYSVFKNLPLFLG